MSKSVGTSTREALGRAREHAGEALEQAGEALSSIGDAVEEIAHEVVGRVEQELPVLADRAKGLLDESGVRLDEAVTTARKDLARRIEPEPLPIARWRWLAAGALVAAVLAGIAYVVLSRRPQEVPVADVAEPPSTIPPTDVVDPVAARTNGRST
ncbi:MAG: hypothetical protein OJJ54_01585 [Pseudonocardia sp.]|nr:hypothetical protein [Pseudonocardia sp.]